MLKSKLFSRHHIARVKQAHKHPFMVPVITFVLLSFVTLIASVFFGGYTVHSSDSHVVQLSLDGKKQIVPTRASTVQDFLNRAKVSLHEGDVVEPAIDTTIVDDNFRINIYRARPVTIFDGEKRIQALSAATTPRSVAAQVGVQVYPEDNLDQQVSNNVLKDQVIGEKIVIERATPVHLNLYGTAVEIRTQAKTVGELLKEKNITLTTGDSVQPGQETLLSANTSVFVTRAGTQITTVEEVVPMPSEIIEDPGLSFGTTALRQAGSDGKKLVTYQLELINGKEVSRKLIQEVQTVPPVKQITARGKAVSIPADHGVIMRAAGVSESDYPYVEYIINHENAMWCPTRWQGQNFCPAYYAEKFPGAETDTSTGYGLCQSTPAIKMAANGEDWRTNPVTQLRWCQDYALRRYHSWAAAYNYWTSHHNW